MEIVKLTTNGQITIPARMRKAYGLTAGRQVKFIALPDGIKIVPLVSHKEIKANAGFLGMKGKMLKSLLEEKKIEKEY